MPPPSASRSGDDEAGHTAAAEQSITGELNRLARGGTLSLAGMVLNAVLGFVALLLVSRVLSTQRSGAMFEAVAAFTILSNVAELGADTGLLRFVPQVRRDGLRALRSLAVAALVPSIITAGILTTAAYLTVPQEARLLAGHAAHSVPALRAELRIVLAFVPAASVMTVTLAAVRAWSIKRSVGVMYVAIPTLRIVLLLPLLASHPSPELVALAWVMPYGLGAVVSLWWFSRLMIWNEPHGDQRWPSVAELRHQGRMFWRFSAPRSLGATFQILITWIDVLLVGSLASPGSAALYNVASRYVAIGTYPLQGVAYAVTPQFARLMSAGRTKAAAAIYQVSTCWTVLASWPGLLLFVVFGSTWMKVFGADYTHGATALAVIAAGMLANCGTGPSGQALGMAGGTSANMAVAGVSLAANLGLNVALIPRYGISGAAIAWLVSLVITSALTSTLLWRATRISPFSRSLLIATAVSSVIYAAGGLAVRVAAGSGLVVLVGFAAVATACYLAVIFGKPAAFGLDGVGAAAASRLRRPRKVPPLSPPISRPGSDARM